MDTKRVLVTLPVEESHVNMLQEAAPGWEFRFRGSDRLIYTSRENAVKCPALQEEDVAWAQVILGNVPPKMLAGAKDLLWLQTNSAGVEDYVRPGVLLPHTQLTNATGAYGLAISEYMLGVLLNI